MTPDQIHGALIIAAYVLGTLAAIGVASLLLHAIDGPRSVDEHTRQHRDHDDCPWCAASDEAVAERARQKRRAAHATERRDKAERRLRSVDPLDAELAELLRGDAS